MTTDDRAADRGVTSSIEEAVRGEFDWSETVPSTAVVEVVASASNRDPMSIEPLYDAIDPDALDTIVADAETRADGDVTVEFTFDGYEVTVSTDGSVLVRPAQRGV